MVDKHIQRVGVAGAGVMGAGIAYCALTAGYTVVLYDAFEASLRKGEAYIHKELDKAVEKGRMSIESASLARNGLVCVSEASALKADLIVEAVIEKLDVKQALFRVLEEVNAPDSLLSTNTSSIPVTRIAAGLERPERFCGIHFFNPAQIMKLVEVIAGAHTASNTMQRARSFAESLNKVVVEAKDAPGFIVNRVARHYYVESLKLMEEGVADFAAIDRLLEASGFRMGPFRLMDLIGVETNYSVTESMYNLFNQDPKFRPSRIQKQKVDAGMHGRKTKQGFYKYED